MYPTQTIGPNIRVGISAIAPLTEGETVTLPAAVITTIASVPIASIRSVMWHYTAWKQTLGVDAVFTSYVFANHGTGAAAWVDGLDAVLNTVSDLYDFTMTCDVSAGLLRLRTTPLTGGWQFNVKIVSTTAI